MKILEEKLQNKIERNARFSDVKIDNIEYTSDGAEVTISANDRRSYSNQCGFGKITFKFLIYDDGQAKERIEYIDYSEKDLAEGASGLQYTTLPDEDDPTYWNCVEKIIEEEKEFARSGDIFQFFELPTDYSDCILDEINENDIKQIFENYNINVKNIKIKNDAFLIDVTNNCWVRIWQDNDYYYDDDERKWCLECENEFSNCSNSNLISFDVLLDSSLDRLIESWITEFRNVFEPIVDLYNQMR